MATERNPFDPIPEVEVSMIEIEPEADSEDASIEYDPTDGGVVVELPYLYCLCCVIIWIAFYYSTTFFERYFFTCICSYC